MGSCLPEEFCQKRWPEVRFLSLALSPEFLIKIAGFLRAGLCLELTPRGDELMFLLTVSIYFLTSTQPPHVISIRESQRRKLYLLVSVCARWTEPPMTFICPRGRGQPPGGLTQRGQGFDLCGDRGWPRVGDSVLFGE